MTVSLVQNFYKQTVTTPWTTGTGNFYVSQKPGVTSGFLVISPNSESLREIVSFSAVGTDGGGDYVTVSARGLGGTTEQAHGAGEKVYMNITAQHIEQIKQAIEDINNAGALNASTTVKGVARLTASPNVSLGNPTITIATPAVATLTAHGLTENDEIQFTTTGNLPTGITPAATYYVIATDLTTNTFKFSSTFGGPAVDTSGSQSGTHTLTRVTPRAVAETDTRIPSVDITAALSGGGSFGEPSVTNKFATEEFIESLPVSIPSFQQIIGLSVTEALNGSQYAFGSNSDGSVIYFLVNGSENLYRMQRDTVSGQYLETHRVGASINIPAGDFGSLVVVGSFLYLFTNDGTNIVVRRYSATDLSGGTNMTEPTVACTSWCVAWTDGTDVYLISNSSSTTARRWTISGTTMSAGSTVTCTAPTALIGGGSFWDGVNAYLGGVPSAGSTAMTIWKLTNVDGSAFISTTKTLPRYTTSAQNNGGIFMCDNTRMYIGVLYEIDDATAQIATALAIFPIAKL